jgi:hypothetical protein
MSARYPATPGWRAGPNEATSREAALSVTPTAKTMKAKILDLLADGPASPEELTLMFEARGERVLLNSVRARTTQLYKEGVTRPSGQYGKGESGRVKVIKWEIVPAAAAEVPA